MDEDALCIGCTENIEGVKPGEVGLGVIIVKGWSFHDSGECLEKAQRLAEDDCFYCKNKRVVFRFGGGHYADLMSCGFCRDGKKLADTLIPQVRSTQ